MSFNYLGFAVPFFLFFIGLEYFVTIKQGKKYYKFSSSIANLNVGIIERLIDLFVAGGFYFFFNYLHENFALFDIKATWWLWILLLLATDFLWYWYHRFGHEINLFWGFHVVHHTSEEFNYTAATRITFFQSVVRTLFWSALPIIGFPVEMILTILLIHGAYPFFTHTQTIGKLGWIEYVFVTPSHHRVHHANNEVYLDKNYGDIFIFWDKLFGTFCEEKETATYGLTKQLNSYSVLWQHFHFLIELFWAVNAEKGIWNKIKLVFGSPAKFDAEIRPILEAIFLSKKRVRNTSNRFRNYVIIQIALVMVALFILILFEHHFSMFFKISVSLILLTTVINCGAILEQKRWIFHLEISRIFIISGNLYKYYLYDFFQIQTLVSAIVVFVGCFLLDQDLYKRANNQYLKLVYGNQ